MVESLPLRLPATLLTTHTHYLAELSFLRAPLGNLQGKTRLACWRFGCFRRPPPLHTYAINVLVERSE